MNRLVVVVLILALQPAFGQAPSNGCRLDGPLEITQLQVPRAADSVGAFLLALGQENRLCFGLTVVDRQLLARPVQLESTAGSVREILKRVLPAGAFRYAEEDGLIVIQPTDSSTRGVLDFRMPRFRSDRSPAPNVAGD